METFSALLAICAGNSPVPGEFPTQRPVTRSFDVYFDLRPNKRLSKQSWGWWFETLSPPLWRHRNVKMTPPYFVYEYFNVVLSRCPKAPTGDSTVSSTVCSSYHQFNHQSPTWLALCGGNAPVTGGFPSQRASDAETVSLAWRRPSWELAIMSATENCRNCKNRRKPQKTADERKCHDICVVFFYHMHNRNLKIYSNLNVSKRLGIFLDKNDSETVLRITISYYPCLILMLHMSS